MALSCKPKTYIGPLSSPIGNWKGDWSVFFFNSEQVGELKKACRYSAISFYKDSLCCIEGTKGAFNWRYNADTLTIDSTTVWSVEELYGNRMTLRLLEELEPLQLGTKDYITVPLEYRSKTIDAYRYGYFYLNEKADTVQCQPVSHMEPDSTYTIDFWYDSRQDTYKPLG